MSESGREQHPLLYEGLSDEEYLSPRYQRRFRPMVYKGRASNKARGAASIIRLWPEHWSSSVTYWWLGLGMIGLLTFIIYNSMTVFAMLPPVHSNMEYRNMNTASPTPIDTETPFNVFMHLFIENNQEIDLNNYMPYIYAIANKYSDFKYHLIIILDDTSLETGVLSAEENNEKALNSLWAKNNGHNSQKNNVAIEYVTLSKYMNNSPLRQYWKKLPKQFTEFLTRAVSIWEKGGIAFNPFLLSPNSPHAVYVEKIQSILKSFYQNSMEIVTDQKIIRKQHSGKKKPVNNIRDIIDALENDKKFDNVLNDIKYDKFNHDVETNIKYPQPPKDTLPTTNDTANYRRIHPKFSKFVKKISIADNIKSPDPEESLVMAESKVNMANELQGSNDSGAVGILPRFLEFLFRNKRNLDPKSNVNNEKQIVTRKRKHVASDNTKVNKSSTGQYFEHLDKKDSEQLKPFIISAEPIHNSEKLIETDSEKNGELAIDLKGNIVASGIPCHAFLGTMFSDALNQIEESLTDFIITELSIFCNGALSSCKGVNVILL